MGKVIFTASQFAHCQALKTSLKQVFKYLDSLHPCTIWTSKFQNPGILCVFLCTCVLKSSQNVHVDNSTYNVSVYREDGPEEKDFQFLFLETEIKNSWEAYFEDAKQKLGKH